MPLYKVYLTLCVGLLAVAGAVPVAAQDYAADDEAAIRATFAAYRGAVIRRDGEAAYDVVDARTRAYYDRIADQVKYGEPELVKALPFTDLTILLSSRHFIPRDRLREMDGRALFVHAVERGWTDRELAVAGLGPIRVEGDVAHAPATRQQHHILFGWTFRKEDRTWFLDLVAPLEAVEEGARAMLSREELTPADVAFAMLARTASNPAVTPAIWEPPFTR